MKVRWAMYSPRWTPALLLVVLFAMRSTAANAEPAIGVAASVKPNAESVVGETSQTLSAGNELRANDRQLWLFDSFEAAFSKRLGRYFLVHADGGLWRSGDIPWGANSVIVPS